MIRCTDLPPLVRGGQPVLITDGDCPGEAEASSNPADER